jgi:tetratricopeptide (TPR) repeat protein
MSGISNAPGRPASETEANLQWAIGAINHGRPDDAERFARTVLARVPQHPKALYLLGYALLLQNRAVQAVAPLETAARALQEPAVETQLGIALSRVGRTDDALARLRRATKRRPAHAEAFHELGHLLFSLRHSDEALAVAERGVELAPGSVELAILLGVIRHSRYDLANAKAAFAKALAIAPEHAGAHYGMGAVMVDSGEHASAAEHLRRALASNAADAQALLKLGSCLLELGRTDDAIESFRAAVRSDPTVYDLALSMSVRSGRGRFWLRPSAAAQRLAQASASLPGNGGDTR